MDETIRRYARELERAGIPPRDVAWQLLGVKEPERYWIVAAVPERVQPVAKLPLHGAEDFASVPVSFLLQRPSEGRPEWRKGWSAPVPTTIELVTWAEFFGQRGYDSFVWDVRSQTVFRGLRGGLTSASNVVVGWEVPPEVQAATGVDGPPREEVGLCAQCGRSIFRSRWRRGLALCSTCSDAQA